MAKPLDRDTIQALFDLLEVEGSDFYFNEPNDYGCITMKWFCGEGNPWERYRGDEILCQYMTRDGGTETRGSGRFKLNGAAVDKMIEHLEERREHRDESQ